MIVLFERIVNKIAREYRKRLFLKMTGNKRRYLKVKGKIFVMNRNVSIGEYVSLYPGVQFFGDGKITIGNHVSLGNGTIIYASKSAGVTIGNDVSVGAYSYIIDADHGVSRGGLIRENKLETSEIIIEDDVWLATNVTVLKGSHIRKGAVCGAKALVKGEIEEYGIAVGIPAKVVKKRV